MNSFNSLFLASNSMNGFVSYFKDFQDSKNGWFNYIIKGGPGSGKSTAMKHIANELKNICPEIITVPCSSDPDSLDAVILPNNKIIIADGTAPHIIEPKYAGVTDRIVNFGDTFNYNLLNSKKEEIISVSDEIANIYLKIYRYTKVLGTLLYEKEKLYSKDIDIKSIKKVTEKLYFKYIPKTESKGYTKRCFLRAVTHKGIIDYYKTVGNLCNKIICFSDSSTVASGIAMSELAKLIKNSGYDSYICYNPILHNKPENIIIPNLKIAFVLDTEKSDFKAKKINFSKYLSNSVTESNKEKINFNNHAIKQITEKTVIVMKEAKQKHDLLEKLYSPAVDFKKTDLITKDILNDIKLKIS